MPQIFHHSTNALAKITIYGALFIIVALLWVAVELNRSSWNTGQWVERQQPVQFSHKHHVGDDGVDCRYCHTSVETSSSAGMPSTTTCMNCHKQIWADSPYLEPVRASFRTGKPVEKIYDMEWRQENKTREELAEGFDLKARYKIQGRRVLESCSTCHR